MKTGLVIGKFYPPHAGHSFLIRFALERVDRLVVLVCDRSDQIIAGSLRAQWLREAHPEADVRVMSDILRDDDSVMWARYTKDFLGFTPDVVFTSEAYGDPYARELGSKHVSVDPFRKRVPISATKIRKNPYRHWKYLSPPARAFFIPRVTVLGAESTGTTTMARALAEHYQTVWVSEYGRHFSEGLRFMQGKHEWSHQEFVHIAMFQNAMEDALAQTADRLLICDTDAFATRLWEERYRGEISSEVTALARGYVSDLYLLTAPDIPFKQDGIRDGEHIRQLMHDRFVEELEHSFRPTVILKGSHESRMGQAKQAIEAMLKLSWQDRLLLRTQLKNIPS